MKTNTFNLPQKPAPTGWLRTNLRILWAITSKDLLETLKNKNTIALLISALFVVVMYRFLPLLTGEDQPGLSIYIAGQSQAISSPLAEQLKQELSLPVIILKSEERLFEDIRETEHPQLGIMLPADLQPADMQQSGADLENIVLSGYLSHWVKPADADSLTQQAENQLTAFFGVPVEIQTTGNIIYPDMETMFLGLQAVLGIAFMIIMVGLLLVPHLMLEEKQSHTMEGLLVSPATAWHIAIAKLLTGIIYCLLVGLIGLSLNSMMVLNWVLGILAILCGSLFTVSLGLWLGLRIESRAQLSMSTWILIIPLFIPMLLVMLAELFPGWVVQVARFIPTTAMITTIQAAFVYPYPVWEVVISLLYQIAWGIGVLAVVAWQLKRHERQPGGSGFSSIKLTLGSDIPEDTSSSAPILDALSGLFTRKSPVTVDQGIDPAQMDQEMALPSLAGSGRTQAAVLPSPRIGPVTPPAGWRIILAIAWKDIQDALKNRLVLSILIATLMMILLQSALPWLLTRNAKPVVAVYDEGRSSLLASIAEAPDFYLRSVESIQEMQELLVTARYPILGLVLPADFDTRAGQGEDISLQGYFANTTQESEANDLVDYYSLRLNQVTKGEVRIDTLGNIVYPDLQSVTNFSTFSILLITSIYVIGLALVPLLMVEERESGTLQMLLVSPARKSHILLGKFLTGLFYCSIAGAILVIMNTAFFIHWGVLLLALFLLMFFTVAIGLLIGILAENPTNVSLISSLVLLPVLGMALLRIFAKPDWSPVLLEIIKWFPTVSVLNLFDLSMVKVFPWDMLVTNVLVLVASILLLLIASRWLMQRKM